MLVKCPNCVEIKPSACLPSRSKMFVIVAKNYAKGVIKVFFFFPILFDFCLRSKNFVNSFEFLFCI